MSFFPCLKLPTVSSGKISQNILASLQKERFNRGKLNAFIMPRKGSTKLDSGGGNLVEKVCKKEKKKKKSIYVYVGKENTKSIRLHFSLLLTFLNVFFIFVFI